MRHAITLGLAVLVVALLFYALYPTLTGNVTTSLNSCYDSDGGIIIGVKGKVTGEYYLQRTVNYSEEDYCLDEQRLVEWYCINREDHLWSQQSKKIYPCSTRCEDGACVGEAEPNMLSTTTGNAKNVEAPKRVSLIKRIGSWLGF